MPLTSGSVAPGITGLIVNPYHLWTQLVNIERTVLNSPIDQPFYTCYSTNASTLSARVFDTANYQALTLANQYSTSNTVGYAGWCRPQGVKFTITYLGTDLNKGGEIVVFTNPKERPLALVDNAILTANNALASLTFTELNTMQDCCTIHRMDDRFSFVWRPPNTEFRHVQSDWPVDEMSATALNAENSAARAAGYTSAIDENGGPTPLGWTTGFAIRPASATTAALSNYMVEVEAVYDLALSYMESAQTSATQPHTMAHSHPAHTAAIHNALAHVHFERSNAPVRAAKNLAIQTGKRLLTGAVEGLGERIAASFA